MPFPEETRGAIDRYARGDLRPRQWHTDYFDFISDPALRTRLGEEFFTARYLYKLLEGLAADGELLVAQVRLQVLQYASIYEASIHHLLFEVLGDHSSVQELREYSTLKQYSVPPAMSEVLTSLVHDERHVVPAYFGIARVGTNQVRFDDKAKCARGLGLLEPWLCDELIVLYETRNAIHLHAEIRKGIIWGLELAKNAYRRLEPFKEQVLAGLTALSRERRQRTSEAALDRRNRESAPFGDSAVEEN